MPKPVDKDARLLGLALLHGYLEAGELEAAAREDPSPSAILKSLRAGGILDEPCLLGLEQGLEDLDGDCPPPGNTSSTRAVPHVDSGGTHPGPGLGKEKPQASDSFAEDGPAAMILRKLTIARWKQYRHLRFIGEGGMGRIFKAVDPDLNRTVALKFLRGQDPGQLRRFLFEAQAQALVEHPNICQVHEVSEWQGQHYIAMQYVNGPTLLKVRGELTSDQKLQLMETVAEAVHAAHCRGLIHRDLKPTNILVEKDSAGRLKPFVLDFGLARDTQTRDFTLSGLVVGTTAYMAPEQARGEAHHIDRRTDVYSLGATLYELFAGGPPFGDAKGLDCLRKVVEEEPPPLRGLAPEVHPDLETIVSKCLEKDPARRYDDALALAEDLKRFREGDPILARPATLGYRLGKFARKNRVLVAMSGSALLALVLLAGVAAYARINATARELAAQHFSQEAERIEAMLGNARRLPVQNIEPYIEKARQRLTRLQAEVARSRGNAVGSGEFALGRALLAFREVDKALPRLEEALRHGLDTPELASALGRGYTAVYQRELERARRMNAQGEQEMREREARIREVERRWRDPALLQLRKAKAGSLESQETVEALVDWYEGHLDSALEKVRSAISRDPSFYEAKGLEGELLLAQARMERERNHPGRALELIEGAGASFQEARRVAPCDTSLWLNDAKAQVEALRLLPEEPARSQRLERCRRAAQICLQVQPRDPAPLAQVAQGLYWVGKARSATNQNPEPAFEEGLDLTWRVLADAPGNFDALVARMSLFEVLGLWRRFRNGDPEWAYQQGMNAAREALRLHPGDWVVLTHAAVMAQSKFIWDANIGRDVEPSFQFARDVVEQLLQQNPDSPLAHFRVATLFLERAEFDRLHGKDPGPSVEKVRMHLVPAQAFAPNAEGYLESLGTCSLILGQHALATGQEAGGHFDTALGTFVQLAQVAPSAPNFGVYAETCFFKALAEARAGRNPGTWVARMDQALGKGLGFRTFSWLIQLQGQSEWLKARWKLLEGRDPSTHFSQSVALLDRALAMAHEATTYRWLARVHLDRAGLPGGGSDAIRKGLQAATSACEKDPNSGEAALLLGQLQALAAERNSEPSRSKLKAQADASLRKALDLNVNLKLRAGLAVDPASRHSLLP